MSTRILHVSDLHLGARRAKQDATFGVALAALVERLDPALVIATGDLTHRGRPAQHSAAADFLRGLGRPLLVVPGNHDIPYSLPARLTAPWREFERCWTTTEPVHSSPALQAVGLNSARPLRHQNGRIGRSQLARATGRLAEGAPGAFRIAAFHHQLLGAPWRSRKRPLARRSAVLAGLRDAGAELVVGGHIHQVAVCAGQEFEIEPASVLVTTAPGLGRPRPHRRGEACGALAYVIDDAAIVVETYLWRQPGFELTASRRFARGGGPMPPAGLGDGCHAGEPLTVAEGNQPLAADLHGDPRA